MILDVHNAPEVPSLFDETRAKERSVAIFMRSFIADFRAPVDRRNRPHIDYLPTQVVTEYFRTSVEDANGDPILGILCTSTKNGHEAIVLFAEKSRCRRRPARRRAAGRGVAADDRLCRDRSCPRRAARGRPSP